MGVSKAYLDSSYLLALVKEEDWASEVSNMLYKLKNNSFDVFVPHVVLGEVCGIIFRDFKSDQDRRDKTVRLVNMMIDNGIKWKNMKPTTKDAFDIIITLNKNDASLDPTDIMIVSHVLADPDSKFFFTVDSDILENVAITSLEKELNYKGKRHTTLKISDGFKR